MKDKETIDASTLTFEPIPQLQAARVKVKLLRHGPTNKTVFVLGANGSGKTTLIANLLLPCKRFVIFDAKQDYAAEWFEQPNLPTVCKVSTVEQLAAEMNAGRLRIVFEMDKAIDPDSALNQSLLFIYQFQLQNSAKLPPLTIALDELNRFVDSASVMEGLRDVIQRGRSLEIQKIFGAQWFGTIPTWVRDSFSELYVFRHTDPAGLQRLEEYGLTYAEVRNLPQYTVLHYSGGQVRKLNLVADSTP